MTVKDALTFTSKLSYFYDCYQGSGIQNTLLEYFTADEYTRFCDISTNHMKYMKKENESTPRFKKEMLNNPYNVEDVVTNQQVRDTWTLTGLIDAIEKTLH